jgi:signal transduction histidine kinase/ActR/RegA family two-component response regulator
MTVVRASFPRVPMDLTMASAARESDRPVPRRSGLQWRALPREARVYVGVVIAAGAAGFAMFFPRTFPNPSLFAVALIASCLTSVWKVTLPISLTSGSTLSMSYAANLMALLLLGPRQAMLAAVAGAWTQCTVNVKQPYPLYRTVFSVSAEAITMAATGLVSDSLGGSTALADLTTLPKPLVCAIATYFAVNTGLVAGAIAWSTNRRFWTVWRDDFLWSSPSFIVAGGAGATAAIILARGHHWMAVLVIAPIYLTYWTWRMFLGRFEDQKRHFEETRTLHEEAVTLLRQARHAERALVQEKERLAVTLHSIGDGVITTDLEGTIRLVSSAAEALTGWSRDDAIGKPLSEVFRTRDGLLIARDSRERPIEENDAPLRDAEGRVVGQVITFRDISDALRLQEERAKASKLASLGLLAGGIAHDFNDILMTVMGNVSMARSIMPLAAPDWLADAEHACVRARQLTWQLLTFSKGGVPTRSPVRLAAISQGGVIRVRMQNVQESTSRHEYALPVDPGRYVRVSISDDGTGIEPVYLNRIFDPYFSTKQRGSGLGLATTYAIVKNHRGFLTVDSTVGRGTTIHVNLPTPDHRTGADEPLATTVVSAGRRRVLVMDDDASARALTGAMLECLGYQSEAVESGSAAVDRFGLARANGHPFDVVLLDLTVPGHMGGREAMQRLAELDPTVKGILVSGFAPESAAKDYLAYGFSAMMTKPFTLQELGNALSSVVTAPAWPVH